MATVTTQTESGDTAIIDTNSVITTQAAGVYTVMDQVDNGASNNYVDVLLGGKFSLGATVADGETVDIYIVGGYTDTVTDLGSAIGATGLIAATSEVLTADTEFNALNMRILETLDVITSLVFHMNPKSVAALFGGRMPTVWSVIIHNNTAAAFTSGSTMSFKGITYTNT